MADETTGAPTLEAPLTEKNGAAVEATKGNGLLAMTTDQIEALGANAKAELAEMSKAFEARGAGQERIEGDLTLTREEARMFAIPPMVVIAALQLVVSLIKVLKEPGGQAEAVTLIRSKLDEINSKLDVVIFELRDLRLMLRREFDFILLRPLTTSCSIFLENQASWFASSTDQAAQDQIAKLLADTQRARLDVINAGFAGVAAVAFALPFEWQLMKWTNASRIRVRDTLTSYVQYFARTMSVGNAGSLGEIIGQLRREVDQILRTHPGVSRDERMGVEWSHRQRRCEWNCRAVAHLQIQASVKPPVARYSLTKEAEECFHECIDPPERRLTSGGLLSSPPGWASAVEGLKQQAESICNDYRAAHLAYGEANAMLDLLSQVAAAIGQVQAKGNELLNEVIV